MVRLALCVAVLAGCYSPGYRDCEVTCESGNGCPSGLSCESGMCRTSGHGDQCGTTGGSDSGTDSTDADPGDGGGDGGPTLGVLQVVAHADHTCARCGDGSLWCWGSNQAGESSGSSEIASCTGTQGCNPHPTHVTLGGGVHEIGLGATHSCAAHGNGNQLACWGANLTGQFGSGTLISSTTPVDIVGRTATSISGGDGFSCFVMGSQAFCTGKNGTGQLGDNSMAQHVSPDQVSGLSSASAIAAGVDHACGIMNGSVMCWGNNAGSKVVGNGNATPASSLVPVAVALNGATEIALGDSFSCALNAVNDMFCWGSNQLGQFGDGAPGAPIAVKRVQTQITHVAAGGSQTCTIDNLGGVHCSGQLATEQVTSPVPISLPAGRKAVAITAGARHACAILDDGTLVCWGANTLGQLGIGTFDAASSTLMPQPVHVCE